MTHLLACVSSQETSVLLLNKMRLKESTCSFFVDSQEYKVDLVHMFQTNVTTGFQRSMRCRPVFRPAESMWPHLRSVSRLFSWKNLA